jgi:EAP30/Vps36 family
VDECLKWVNKLRGERHSISLQDLFAALDTLKVLGSGMNVIEGETKMILSVPLELNLDQKSLIDKAKVTGYVTYSMFQQWNATRFANAAVTHIQESLISEGLVWLDSAPNGDKLYWFPAQSLLN